MQVPQYMPATCGDVGDFQDAVDADIGFVRADGRVGTGLGRHQVPILVKQEV